MAVADCTDACLFLDELGYASAPGPFFATLIAVPLLQAIDHDILNAVLTGEVAATVGFGGTLIPDADLVDYIVLVSPSGAIVVETRDTVELERVNSVDHSRRWFRYAKVHSYLDAESTPAGHRSRLDAATLGAWRDRSHACAAADLVGTARRMLSMTLMYAKQREQFAKPIGSFQAIQHKLADMALGLERATAAVHFAAMTVDAKTDDRAFACHSAKAAANDAAVRILKDAIQIHGGVGFTWEHDLQMYLRRATMGATQFGTTTWHLDQIAELLFAPPPR